MGPNESKLRQVESAIPGALTGKAIDWDAAKTKLEALRTELVTAQQQARETWTEGSDAEAADAAFTQKLQTIETMQTKLEQTAAGMRAGAEALSTARSDLQNLPEISPAPGASPTRPGADASDADIEAYNTAKSEHDSAASSHATSVERRENDAAAALTRLDAGLAAAQKMLATAAPADQDRVDGGGPSSTHSSPSGSGPGLSGTPVVGGTTAVSAMASAATIGRGPRGTNPTLVSTVKNGSNGGGDGRGDADGDGLTDLDTGLTDGGSSLGQAGGMGAGGVGGAAGAAGLLGAGKGILAKAAGAAKGAASSAGGGSGRTAGMAKGSTLGSSSSQSNARVANPASQSSARPSTSQASRAGAQPARSAPGTGSRAGAGTRAGQSEGAGAGRGGAANQAGRAGNAAGRSANGTGRGANGAGRGANGAGRGAEGSAGRSGAGAGGQGRRNRDEDETTQDHLAFDDDQWLDDDETSPGVLS